MGPLVRPDAEAGGCGGAYAVVRGPAPRGPGLAEQFEGVEQAGWRKRVRIPVSLLAAPEVGDTVVSALEDFLETEG